jgi:predicted GH43/DUF377 family glycosyl hydrolase
MFTRCVANPIVRPGRLAWRQASVFNPGAILDDGRVLLYERAAGSLTPFQTVIGALISEDGAHFEHACAEPIFTGTMVGYPEGSIEDARVVKIDGVFYMCYALQPYQFDCYPTGLGIPDYHPEHYPEWEEHGFAPMITRSGIAVSRDGIHFTPLCFTTPPEIDDRDNTLFPEKIDGRFALLRRPMQYVGSQYGTDRPGIWISFSEDLLAWTDPELVAVAEQPDWEGEKIGAAATPLRTERGWLVLYHGVDKRAVYRVGAMLLDLADPRRVLARTPHYIMEPEAYYETTGLVIPNVIFPTGNFLRNGLLNVYYGCCDTAIGLATAPLADVLAALEVR